MGCGVGSFGVKIVDNHSRSSDEIMGPRLNLRSEEIKENLATKDTSCKRKAHMGGAAGNSSAQPLKRTSLSKNGNVDNSTVALVSNNLGTEYFTRSGHINSFGLCNPGILSCNSLEAMLSQRSVGFNAEDDNVNCTSRGGIVCRFMDCRADSKNFTHEMRGQETDFECETHISSGSTSPDLMGPFWLHENKVRFAACIASQNSRMLNQIPRSSSNSDEQLSQSSWSQECFCLQKSLDEASNVNEIGLSCSNGNKTLLGGLNVHTNQSEKLVDSQNAECSNKLLSRREVQTAGSPDFNKRLGSAEITSGMSHSSARLFDNFDILQGDANVMVTTGPHPTGFSFQRLINGDITGFEHEFEENSDEDSGEKNTFIHVEPDEDDCDMYSMVCSPSTPCHSQTLEVCVEVQGPTVQDSDDGSKGLSTCAPMKRGQSEDLDSEISEVPRTSFKVASSSKLAQHYGSPCVQQKIDDDCQTSSDSSRDLYLEGLAGSSGQVVWHGSPSLDSSMDVYRPILPSGSHLEEKVYSYIENQSQVSPCMHPVSKSDQQPSSDVSEDLSMCPKPRGTSSNIVGQKEETVSSKVSHNEIAGRFENHDEISKLIEAPSTAKAILSSGLFDGFVVSYRAKGGGVMLTGAVKNGGIMCNCRHCKGRTVVNISCFEKHAGSTARHPSENIFFENGKSLLEVMRNGWYSSDSKSANATERVIKNSTGAVVAYSDMNSIKPVTPNQQQRHQAEFYAFKAPQTVPPAQKRDLNKLLFLPGGLADGTEVAYYMKGQRFLTGTKMGHGILCDCCNEVISCSLFEAHAGWGSRRNPYQCIFLSDGRSLHKYAQSLAIKLQENSRGSSRDNEDLCAECGDGGDLVLCDACPLAYHSECVGLPNIPEGEWFCPQCDEKSEYASNDRKQGGEKRMQQHGPRPSSIARRKDMERCQRIVKASDNTIGGCVICKNGDFLKTGFGAKTVLLCDQCEREFHVGCLKEKAIADLQELPAGEWFCGPDCTHIQKVLKKLVLGGPNTVCNSICKAVLDQKEQQKRTAHVDELTWQLLHGRRGDPRNGKILSEAATILAESFDPIVDAASGRDLISVMVHSRNIRDQDFGGMYCAVLKKKDAIVSTAVIRIFGKHFAEMPLVATSTAYRGQGFFQILMLNIEKLLGMLRVEHLVLPATTEAEGIWINKFGFSKLNDKQVEKIVSQVQIMMFQGSLMLSKRILQ